MIGFAIATIRRTSSALATCVDRFESGLTAIASHAARTRCLAGPTPTKSRSSVSSLPPVSEPRADVVEEGRRLVTLAVQENLPLRLLGGVAIRLRGPETGHSALERSYADLDFAAGKGSSRKAASFFEVAGYVPDVAFNTLQGSERLLFWDGANRRQVDVFVGVF